MNDGMGDSTRQQIGESVLRPIQTQNACIRADQRLFKPAHSCIQVIKTRNIAQTQLGEPSQQIPAPTCQHKCALTRNRATSQNICISIAD